MKGRGENTWFRMVNAVPTITGDIAAGNVFGLIAINNILVLWFTGDIRGLY